MKRRGLSIICSFDKGGAFVYNQTEHRKKEVGHEGSFQTEQLAYVHNLRHG